MKKKVLFVGAFRETVKSGGTGGQIYACRSLINSDLSKQIEWLLLDTTSESIPPPALWKRGWNAVKRILKLIKFLLLGPKFEAILIFCADGWSFIEKGVMAILGKLFGKKVIICPRSGIIISNIEKAGFRRFFCYVAGKADIILCQSNKWKDVFSSIIDKGKRPTLGSVEKLIVLQNWINPQPYICNRPQYEPNTSKVTFLYLGWLEKFKGIEDFIRAIEIVKDKFCGFHFTIAGNGSEMQAMKELAEKLSVSHLVDFLGWVDYEQKMKLFRNSDVFILPSHFEGFPNALMEAMASSMPCIATRVGAIEDIIVHGENGLLIDPMKPVQIADAIAQITGDTEFRIKIGENARKTILTNNSVDAAVAAFRKILF